MTHDLPKITFKSNIELDIEVMTFAETYDKLSKSSTHDHFSSWIFRFDKNFQLRRHYINENVVLKTIKNV